ncbi:MAG: lipopolysaccharide heptosyltransferase II [Candidatus Glassbacteria bacterium]|nr:lipopolysaccharide heptosyltransferase II [Candidatus Glassbacteria bacterium]
MPARFDRILIFNSAFPGDIVLTTPLIRAAYQSFPGASLTFCTTEAGASLLAGMSYLDSLIVYDKHGRDKGTWGMLKTAARLRRESFDLVFAAHRSARTAMLLALAGIPVRVGFQHGSASWLYTHLAKRRPGAHETERNLSLLGPLGIELGELSRKPVLPVTGEEANHVFGHLGVGLPRGRGPLVIVAPGSVWGTKQWFADRFAGLIELLTAAHAARVIMVGSPLDRAQADKVADACRCEFLDLVGMTDLRGLTALIRKADLVITGDSAPMHIAWAMDTPAVAIFGATTPELGFAPLSGRCRVVEIKSLECRPCSEHGPRNCPLGHFRCMSGITVDMVMTACEEMLRLGPDRN